MQDRSVSGETLFVEPMWAVELNNRLMLIEREAAAEEYRLLMRLSAMVRGYAPELRLTFEALTELDALNARAIFAARFGGVEPELSDDEIANQRGAPSAAGRDGRAVVPIDLRIGPGQRGIVISGPNTGGKTVALKTLGLFALMAQAGSRFRRKRAASSGSFAASSPISATSNRSRRVFRALPHTS